MPPAKVRDESRSEASNARDRQIAAAAHARKSKIGTSAPQNGSSLRELALVSTESGNVVAPGQGTGVCAIPRHIRPGIANEGVCRWPGTTHLTSCSTHTESFTTSLRHQHLPRLSTKHY